MEIYYNEFKEKRKKPPFRAGTASLSGAFVVATDAFVMVYCQQLYKVNVKLRMESWM